VERVGGLVGSHCSVSSPHSLRSLSCSLLFGLPDSNIQSESINGALWHFTLRSYACPLSYGNKGAGADPGLWGDSDRGAHELGEGGGWVIDVTVWVLQAAEGRTLISVQRDAVLDAQWQVRLESKRDQDAFHHILAEERIPTLAM